jgi:hypothetical protein
MRRVKLTQPLDFGGAGNAPADELLEIVGEYGAECWRATFNGATVIVPRAACVEYEEPPTPEQAAQRMIEAVQAAVQQRLDGFCQQRGYDGVLSACTYVTSGNPKFAAEGQYAVEARDAHWTRCYEILGAVQAGLRPMPAAVDEVLAEMPALVWPGA